MQNKEVLFCSIETANNFINSEECAAVILHSLHDSFLPLLEDIPTNKKVIWLGWGYDYYDRLLSTAFPEGLLLKNTKTFLLEAHRYRTLKSIVPAFKRVVKYLFATPVGPRFDLLQRIDYFSPVLDVEYTMARELNPWFKPKFSSWNYGTLEDDLGGLYKETELSRANILVGNSAAPENNHIEVFNLLKSHVNLKGRKIIVPLSYGDERYRERITEAGYRIFGEKFVPLADFMSKDAYIELLDVCGYVFMNHLRQQAVGNICIMMLKGAKIFMNSKSPAYRWFMNKGAIIGSIDEHFRDESARSNILIPLTKDARERNIDVLKRQWGRDVQQEKTRQLIAIALDTTGVLSE